MSAGGGCVTPFGSEDDMGMLQSMGRGKDCSAIPHVSAVSCVHGRCQVEECRPGYEPSAAGDSCQEEWEAFLTYEA
jgi:hypothetical protein